MLGNRFGHHEAAKSAPPFYRPYKNDGINHLYNLLFCDDPALFSENELNGPLATVLSETVDRESLEKLGNNLDLESRVRILAFNRLRAMNASVPRHRLLGTIIEVPEQAGLGVLATFPDGRLRYINHSENVAIFEAVPAELTEQVEELLRVSQIVVNRIGPWVKPRLPPPRGGRTRMSFLVSDGLYFGEGRYADLMRDQLASAVMQTAAELQQMVVGAAREKKHRLH
jgi:hypothetical protein